MFRSILRVRRCAIFFTASFILLIYSSIKRISDVSLSSTIVISLTTTSERFHHELPLAIHSLLTQQQLPQQIRIYIPFNPTLTISRLRKTLKRYDGSSSIRRKFNRLVKIIYQDNDEGPAMKFLPIIREFHRRDNRRFGQQAIVICDDDQYYPSDMILTLNTYAKKYPNSIVGFRGWRVRRDLIWGVAGLNEIAYHIVESSNIAEPYRVGIVTANNAYLVRPAFFTSEIYEDFHRVPLDIRQVDDIWLNGYAARRNISRYVVPSSRSPISLTQSHALETRLQNYGFNRLTANNNALKWFSKDWEKNLWYEFNGMNRPKSCFWLTSIYRKGISLFYQFNFVLSFGSRR